MDTETGHSVSLSFSGAQMPGGKTVSMETSGLRQLIGNREACWYLLMKNSEIASSRQLMVQIGDTNL